MSKTIHTPAHEYLINKLKKTRLLRGLKQAEIATLLGWDQTSISRLETGERRLDLIEFLQLCEVLEISWQETIEEIYQKLEKGNG